MTLPRIGITPSADLNQAKVRRYNISIEYSAAVQRAGGLPLILPLHIAAIDELLDTLDGLVFSGGGDIDPALFAADRNPLTGDVDDERDHFEITLMNAAIQRDMPVLAICRGVQVLNVALGGTLIQDIRDETGKEFEHQQRRSGTDEHAMCHTAVLVDGGGMLAGIESAPEFEINSFHHQALGRVANGLTVTAKSHDDLVEAVEVDGKTFGLGVQWHPERLAEAHTDQQAIFDAFVTAARSYREALV